MHIFPFPFSLNSVWSACFPTILGNLDWPKTIITSMLLKPVVKSQSSLLLIYQQKLTLLSLLSHWKHFLHFVFRKPSPLLLSFFSLSCWQLLLCLLCRFLLSVRVSRPIFGPLLLSLHLPLGDRISFNKFKDHPTLTSTKLLSPSKTLLLNSRLIKPSIYLPWHLRLKWIQPQTQLNWTDTSDSTCPKLIAKLSSKRAAPSTVFPISTNGHFVLPARSHPWSLPSLFGSHTHTLFSLPANPVCSTFQIYLEIQRFLSPSLHPSINYHLSCLN